MPPGDGSSGLHHRGTARTVREAVRGAARLACIGRGLIKLARPPLCMQRRVYGRQKTPQVPTLLTTEAFGGVSSLKLRQQTLGQGGSESPDLSGESTPKGHHPPG